MSFQRSAFQLFSFAAPRSVLRNALTLITLFVISTLVLAKSPVGLVTHVVGTLVVKKPDGSVKLLAVKSELHPGDVLSTQQASFARVRFSDGTDVALRPNSQLVVKEYSYAAETPASDNVSLDLRKGGMRMVTGLLGKRNPDKVRIDTPAATIGIRGTHLGLLVCQDDCLDFLSVNGAPPRNGLHADVADGVIAIITDIGVILVHANEFGFSSSRSDTPTLVEAIRGLVVTLPESISLNGAGGRSLGEERKDCNCGIK
jgi:hypothetical protein